MFVCFSDNSRQILRVVGVYLFDIVCSGACGNRTIAPVTDGFIFSLGNQLVVITIDGQAWRLIVNEVSFVNVRSKAIDCDLFEMKLSSFFSPQRFHRSNSTVVSNGAW